MFRYFTKVNNSLEANSKYIFYTHTPSAKSLPFQIGACGHFFCAKDYNVERAGHNFLLIIVTLSGSGEIFYKNRHYTLHKGHAFIIDCSEYHYYRTRGQSWEIKWVRYKCHKAIDYNQLINKGSLEIIFMENAAMINKYIDTIILLSQRHSPTTHFSLSNLISAILTELCMIQYENSSQHIAVSTRKTIFDAVLY
ncbi:MAG: AraC family ligand binding domain-containing protein, partial [Sporomusaceae bacterium]|nr:AraC family ligand binding domain-containing protein [Sporomusaceae bacterium]